MNFENRSAFMIAKLATGKRIVAAFLTHSVVSLCFVMHIAA